MKHSIHRWRVAIVVGFLAAVVSVGAFALHAVYSPSQKAAAVSSRASSHQSVDMDVLNSGLQSLGITYQQTISPVSQQDRTLATDGSQQGFEAVVQGESPDLVEDVQFTDSQYGSTNSDDSVNPTYTDADAIMVVYSAVPLVPSLPYGDNQDVPNSLSYFVAFIDPTTGDSLDAVSFPMDGSD